MTWEHHKAKPNMMKGLWHRFLLALPWWQPILWPDPELANKRNVVPLVPCEMPMPVMYSFYSFRRVVAALAFLHARRPGESQQISCALGGSCILYMQILWLVQMLKCSIQNIYVHSPKMETEPKQWSSWVIVLHGPFLSSAEFFVLVVVESGGPLFRLHLFCHAW